MPAILQRLVSSGALAEQCRKCVSSKMSTDKENAENGSVEVEETSNETSDTKPTTDAEVTEETPGRSKEKDTRKKMKGKEAKKESKGGIKPKEEKTGTLKNNDSESDELEEDGEDEENEENDENEKSGDDKVPLLDQPLELSGTRERKKVQRFSAEYKTEPKDAGPIEIPEGKGAQLGDIPRIEANIQKSKIDALKPLHRILFIRVGKAKFLKKNIRKFNGFDFDEQSDQYAKKKQLVLKFENKVLREICSILDLRKPSKREELVETILTFLLKPEDSGKPVSKARPKRAARSNHKSYSESDDDDDEDEKGRKSSRQGKKKHINLKEVSSDGDEDEDFENERNRKDQQKYENLADGVKSKERKGSKGSDSDNNSKENETDEGDNKEDKDEGSSGYSDEDKSNSKKGSGKNNKKQLTKKTNTKKSALKKSDKKPSTKKRVKSEDESSEDEPLAKKSKAPPSDEEIKSYVKEILEGANLEETTMKIVCKQVYAHYPDFDLAHKKDFIKTTVKSLIST